MTKDDDSIRRIAPLIPVHTVDIGKLGRDLDRASKIFENDPLQGWHLALVVLQPLLKVTDPDWDRGHRRMLSKLAAQLDDLQRGRQPELLRKRKLPHRPPDSIEIWRLRAIAVHIADLLVLTGLASDDADRKVIELCEQCSFIVSPRPEMAHALKVFSGWRSDLVAGRAPKEGLVAYRHLSAKTIGVPCRRPKAEVRRDMLHELKVYLLANKSLENAQKGADSG